MSKAYRVKAIFREENQRMYKHVSVTTYKLKLHVYNVVINTLLGIDAQLCVANIIK